MIKSQSFGHVLTRETELFFFFFWKKKAIDSESHSQLPIKEVVCSSFLSALNPQFTALADLFVSRHKVC
ncbi:hypothetical protein Pyn_23225 [Prunus yedoensis var. nudiflora]|uniref:Uncharacterized protein n=1 Tax=Prunus yedoensis var. nudiflora TaxID=2094558 RepID=A0A314XMB2_PRUYE|nr:hypothetical protein Pyn_23225 [Prunus yedoensis var. nudiflora]